MEWWNTWGEVCSDLLICAVSMFCLSVLWHCWLGHLTRKIVSEMTYDVLSGTLNPTIPYYTILFHCLSVDFPAAVWHLLTNPVYIVTCFGICCEVSIVSGFVVFLPKYLETEFGATKSAANLLTGKHMCWPAPPHCTSVCFCYWRKGNINKNCLCVTLLLCTIIMVHTDTSSSYRSVDCIGIWSCLV